MFFTSTKTALKIGVETMLFMKFLIVLMSAVRMLFSLVKSIIFTQTIKQVQLGSGFAGWQCKKKGDKSGAFVYGLWICWWNDKY